MNWPTVVSSAVYSLIWGTVLVVLFYLSSSCEVRQRCLSSCAVDGRAECVRACMRTNGAVP